MSTITIVAIPLTLDGLSSSTRGVSLRLGLLKLYNGGSNTIGELTLVKYKFMIYFRIMDGDDEKWCYNMQGFTYNC